jgi:hypothetical protein
MTTPNPVLFSSTTVWAAHIAGQANFPDERLTTRFGLILETLADKPLDSFPQATQNAGQAKALYRFLDNRRLDVADFLQPLVDTTVDACRGLPCVLAIQDSSSANYTSLLKTRGLGKLNNTSALGLHFHTTIAVRTDGVACGLLHQSFWTRPPGAAPKDGSHKHRPLADKESYKWLEGIEAAEAAVESLPPAERPRLLHVFDREGDIHEVLQRITDSPHGAVIRAAQNRSVAGPIDKAFAAVAAATLLGTTTIDVPARPGIAKRKAKLELRSVTLTITPSSYSAYKDRVPVTWTLVEAREVDAPAGVAALHWLLWTTEAAQTHAEVLAILRIYKLRWLIEDFHLTLKSGCQIEALRLEAAERLEKAIVLYSSVALRLLALRDLARQQPTAPCTTLLDRDQWQALYSYIHGRRPSADTTIPTIRQAVLWIGRLGGHLNRKGDGLPGVRTLWRGWRDLAILVAGYRAARHPQ